ncbi:MAG: 6-phosphofructokinase [Candidatus Dadabacteria bacterium]|nr:MAG: 6-phosphofructokinase [Candidatus Dadabacteria bacterium]
MGTDTGNFGIIVSGGPAPGINSVIASVTIEAENRGYKVYGFRDGFRGLLSDEEHSVVPLSINSVSHISRTGGSVLGTSRYNPLSHKDAGNRICSKLEKLLIDKLVVIGGEGSAYLSYRLTTLSDAVKVAHIPKTIDNDLILPNDYPSFGFETARSIGTEILATLIEDAITTNRWFIVSSMGRSAGFLALGMGLAAGATLTIIPEEFSDQYISPLEVAEIIFGSILKRFRYGKHYGVALMAEGLIDRFDASRVPELQNITRDELGRIRYADVRLEDLVAGQLRRLCKENELEVKITTKNIGYELRCHAPLSFDIEYTKFLGHGAVRFLLEGRSGIVIVRNYDNIEYVKLSEMLTADGRIAARRVDLGSDFYKVARSFMIR